MCGLAGFINKKTSLKEHDWNFTLKEMADAIQHRGPDDYGIWYDDQHGVGLSHRRLSILDLTKAGHQPMHSSNNHLHLIYNGEIYNHLDIRREINTLNANIQWKGHSDTETLLTSFQMFGIKDTLKKCIGMFSFALWNNHSQTLILGRDRLGEKPLYYGWQDNSFLFASELKAIKKHPSFKNNINRSAIVALLRFSYIPAPQSIYEDILKLEPGYYFELNIKNNHENLIQYWSASDTAVQKQANIKNHDNINDHIDTLENKISKSVHKQMLSDVPLGAFLSGGVDSSTIVAMMAKYSNEPIETFAIGFHEKEFNEAENAKAVANHLKTNHHEIYVSAQDAMDVIPLIPTLYDEPFADSSQLPTYLVSKLAKDHVSVVLSGDAGDEIFSGYQRYTSTQKFWNKCNSISQLYRKPTSKLLKKIDKDFIDHSYNLFRLFSKKRKLHKGYKMHKRADYFLSNTIQELYLNMVSFYPNPEQLVINGDEKPYSPFQTNLELNDISKLMAIDMNFYLPDDILVKVDRASMGISLETRAPFLDHTLIEHAWSIPESLKLRDNRSKWILRQVLYRYVPEKIVDRPKMGFSVPIAEWLRGPLKSWAEDLLNTNRLNHEGFFEAKAIQRIWNDHQSKRWDWSHLLWNILIFQQWLETNHQA